MKRLSEQVSTQARNEASPSVENDSTINSVLNDSSQETQNTDGEGLNSQENVGTQSVEESQISGGDGAEAETVNQQDNDALLEGGGAENAPTSDEWVQELTEDMGKQSEVDLANAILEIHKIKVSNHSRHKINENQFQIRVVPKSSSQEPSISSIQDGIMHALKSILEQLKTKHAHEDYYGNIINGHCYRFEGHLYYLPIIQS